MPILSTRRLQVDGCSGQSVLQLCTPSITRARRAGITQNELSADSNLASPEAPHRNRPCFTSSERCCWEAADVIVVSVREAEGGEPGGPTPNCADGPSPGPTPAPATASPRAPASAA